jgi:small subunit ribosomal protein S25e
VCVMPPKASKPEKAEKSNKGGSQKAKKKWSKGKTREALNNAVLWEKAAVDKLNVEVPKYKVITPSILSDRLKISVALAAEGLKHLAKKGTIRQVSNSGKWVVYTRNVQDKPKEETTKEATKESKDAAAKEAKDAAKAAKKEAAK